MSERSMQVAAQRNTRVVPRAIWGVWVLIGLLGPWAAATRASVASAGTLKTTAHAVLCSGSLDGAAPPSGGMPECHLTACDRFDLTVALPEGTWEDKPGGVEIAVRWSVLAGDNLRLYVYRADVQVASSDGIISTAQAVVIPAARNGLYTVFVAYDPESPSRLIAYDGFARVQYAPKVKPVWPLRPDHVARPQRNVIFETPPPICFDLPRSRARAVSRAR
jgi:hypothetical protein